jgi:predicted ATPase
MPSQRARSVEGIGLLSVLAIANYRSLRNVVLPLSQLNIITGPNGSGKSSVYRALKLLADIAQGGVVATLAREGGFGATLWAGPKTISAAMRRGEQEIQGVGGGSVSLKLGLGAANSDEFSYAIDLGYPVPSSSQFDFDPEIKTEVIWTGDLLRPSTTLVERKRASLRIRDGKGWQLIDRLIAPWASMMTEFADPARQPELGSRTTVMASDGSDFAAALQTILEIGDEEALHATVDDAFTGGQVRVQVDAGRFEVCMQQPGMLRPLRAAELSDGTLRYLLWAAALLTPRAPQLIVLNEPETSLHPDLLPALGRLIVKAAHHTQMIVVSHAPRLIAAMEDAARDLDIQSIALQKELGETQIANLRAQDIPRWTWPTR